MKRKLLSILLALSMALTLLPMTALADEGSDGGDAAAASGKVAKIGDTEYATLAEAVDTVPADNTETEIVLLSDYTGSGIKVVEGKNIVFDLNGKTYTVNKPTVGSPETETNGFQLLKNSKVTFKNGTLNSVTGEDSLPNGGILIQNYCNLTLDNVTLDTSANDNISYVISNNFGSLTAKGNTVIKAAEGKVAFDLWYGMNSGGLYDDGVSVTFGTDFTGSVTGKIEYGAASRAASMQWKEKTVLAIAGGNFDTTFVDSNTNDGVELKDFNISITGGTFFSDVSAYLADDYTQTEGGTVELLSVDNAVAKIGETPYKTLAAAIAAAQGNDTIVMVNDTVVSEGIDFSNKKITLDLNGKTITGEFKDYNSVIEAQGTAATLTIEDNSTGKAGKIISNHYGLSASDGGNLVVNSGTIETGDGAALSGNNTTGDMNLTVNGGTLTTNLGPAIYMPSEVNLTITGGTLNGGVSLRMGQVNISGGTFNSMADNGIDMPDSGTNYAISGNVWFPDALYVIGGTYTSDNTEYRNSLNLNISGGTFNCTNGKGSGIAIYDLGKVEQVMNVTISGKDVKVGTDSSHPAYTVITYQDLVDRGAATNDKYGVVSNTVNSFLSAGYFTSDPSDYVAADHYVDASNNGDYPYIVKEGTKTDGALIVVKDKTDTDVSGEIADADKTAINDVISRADVDGVAEAVDPAKKTSIVEKSGATVNNNDKVEIEVAVKVEATAADLSAGTMTFTATPVATVKVNGTEKGAQVPVTNDMLNGQPITVKLPLPTVDGKTFTPKQILHKFTGGGYEYFINKDEGDKRGANTFEIKDGCAVFTIYGFSTFELSGTVTYVEPSYSSGSSYDPTYSVTVDKTENGAVTVSPKSASKGDTVTITVKPDSGYVLDDLTVTDKNGNELTLTDKGNGKYTFTMPAGKVEVKASFAKEIETSPFADVAIDDYYYEAVKWAVKNGITTGVGNDLFAPGQPCTRAQIVTFLWRASGSPEPKGTAAGMTDVVSGSYYEKAVAWAIENGVTTGTTATTFSPDATCTRAQAVTFLARALNAKASGKAEFSDVPTDSYFADAVAWAAANGVTEGIGGGLFGSDNDCTRGQIVTFLWRAYTK